MSDFILFSGVEISVCPPSVGHTDINAVFFVCVCAVNRRLDCFFSFFLFYSCQGEPVVLQPKDKDDCDHNPPRGAFAEQLDESGGRLQVGFRTTHTHAQINTAQMRTWSLLAELGTTGEKKQKKQS